MKNFFKIILFFSLIAIVFVPVLGNAQITQIVSKDCGVTQPDGSINRECGYQDLLALVNSIINWIILISLPVAAGVFAWAGIKYMTTGVSDQKSAAKAMLQKVFIGFVFILAAWIIVGTIIKALLNDSFQKSVPVDIGVNKFINIYAQSYV
jgi:hypothetical protein